MQTPQHQAVKRTHATRTAMAPAGASGGYASFNTPRFVVSPFALDLGGGTSARIAALIEAKRYEVDFQGDGEIKRLLQVAQIAGIKAPQVNAEGSAKLNLIVGGDWQGFYSPKPIGTAQLRGVTVRMKGVAEPLRIASATVSMAPEAVMASNVSAEFIQSKLALTGSVKLPRQCESIESCPIEFNLRSDQVVTDDLNRLVNPRA